MEDNTREGIIRRTRKEVVGCVQDLVGKKRFSVQFLYRQKKETIAVSLVFLSSKEEIEMDDPQSNSPKK